MFDLCLIEKGFNRLARASNIDMISHQTMFDNVWSPKRFTFGQSFTRCPETNLIGPALKVKKENEEIS